MPDRSDPPPPQTIVHRPATARGVLKTKTDEIVLFDDIGPVVVRKPVPQPA